MDRRVNIALTLSSVIYDDITKAGLEIIDLKLVKVLKNSSTYGAILVDGKNKTFYIVFRGAEDIKDALSSIECNQKKVEINSIECHVHDGFLKAYNSVRDQIDVTPFGSYEIVICGHSLGGALATLCGASLLALNRRMVITFGSPKVGNNKLVNVFTSEVKESLRFVHASDIVPMFPNINYNHVGTEIHLDSNGNKIKSFNRFLYWLRGKCKLFSVNDHLMINYQKAVGKWNSNS